MEAHDWKELPSIWWRYFRERGAWVIHVATGEVVKEVVVISAGIVTSAMAALAHKGDWKDALIWGAVGAVAGLVAIVGFFWIIAPCQIDKQRADQIAEMLPRFSYADQLRQRKRIVEDIHPLTLDLSARQKAMGYLEIQQELFIRLLHRPDSQWQFKPVGWGRHDSPLREWAGLSYVMEHRYGRLGEITPLARLYDNDMGEGQRGIHANNFPLVKTQALECMSLVIREVEQPNRWLREKEPDTAFEDGYNLKITELIRNQPSLPPTTFVPTTRTNETS